MVYRKSWKINFLPPFLEPLFYLLAFGLGLSALVGSIRYQGSEISYTRFIAPALIGVSMTRRPSSPPPCLPGWNGFWIDRYAFYGHRKEY